MREKLFNGLWVTLVCFVVVFLASALVEAERQGDKLYAHAVELQEHIDAQEQVIADQGGLIAAYEEQQAAVISVLTQAAETLEVVAYGPYDRKELQRLISEIADIIREVNSTLGPDQADDISRAIVTQAVAADIDPYLLLSVAVVESDCRPVVRGGSGEYGMMQVMPGTGRWIAGRLGYADFEPSQLQDAQMNIQFATYYLRTGIAEFGGDTQKGLLAYNRGSGGARKWLKENRSDEHRYVKRVIQAYGEVKT
ncbi:MAG: lytic transglycosylase domain-containing protein [Firmicutes bacterium]|nr:lytic transglycosylase domain-containing protein [Bacillota bacterium]